MLMTGIALADIAAQLHNQVYPEGYIPPAPIFTGTSIPNNSLNVSLDQTILINFSEEIWIKDMSLIENTYDFAATEKDFPEGVTLRDYYIISGEVIDRKFPYSIAYYRDQQLWPGSTTVLIKIRAGALNVHEYDNWVATGGGHGYQGADFPDVRNPFDYTFRFTTERGIVPVAVIYPGNSSKDVPLNPTITVIFNRDVLPEHDFKGYDLFANITLRPYENLFINSNSHSKISPSGGAVPLIRSIDGNKVTFQLDKAVLEPATKYEITFPHRSLIAADDDRIYLPWALGVDFTTAAAGGAKAGSASGEPGGASPGGAAGKSGDTGISLVIVMLAITAAGIFFLKNER
jgi:hypothetical protein